MGAGLSNRIIGRLQSLGVFFLLMLSPHFALADFYVSPSGNDSNPGTLAAPFQTVQRARDAVRGVSASMSADIQVYLRGGTYVLSNTLSFGPQDSGRNGFNVIYRAYPGEKPSLSGGRSIAGWVNAGGGIWQAPSNGMRFRQLYVNGQRGIRARTPNSGIYNNVLMWVGPNWPNQELTDGIPRYVNINAGEIDSWNNLNKVEMSASMEWMNGRYRLESFSKSGGVASVVFQYPDVTKAFIGFTYLREPNDQPNGVFPWIQPPVFSPYFFENAREFIDSPGEWYLDEGAGTVYYMPRAGDNMATADVVAPVLERLVELVGSAGGPVQNIQFYGITFEHSTWMSPSDEGIYHGQGEEESGIPFVSFSRGMPGAIHIEYSDGICFERNTIQNTGSSGLRLWMGSRNIDFIGNVVRETSAGGIIIGKGIRGDNADPNNVVRNIVIQSNYIAGIGRDYLSGIGVDAQYAAPLIIDHNEIHDVPYSGVGLDWRNISSAGTDDMQITNNHIYDVMNKLADGGGIYTFWVTRPQTLISGNYVHGVRRSAFGGGFPIGAIYLDEGTNYAQVNNNVLADSDELIHTNWTSNPDASANNSIGNNPGSDAGIEANAGIEAAYRSIKSDNGLAPPLAAPPCSLARVLPPLPLSTGSVLGSGSSTVATNPPSAADLQAMIAAAVASLINSGGITLALLQSAFGGAGIDYLMGNFSGFMSGGAGSAAAGVPSICPNGNLCTFAGVGAGASLISVANLVTSPALLLTQGVILEAYEAMQLTLTTKVNIVMANILDTFTNWFEAFWVYDVRPTMQDMTGQLSALDADQNRNRISFTDANEQVMTQQTHQEDEENDQRKYRDNQFSCEAGTNLGGMQRANVIRKTLNSAWTTEKLPRTAGVVGSPSASGPGADQKVRFTDYKERYCNPLDNRGAAGCTVAGTFPDADLDVTGTLFSKDTIDVRDKDIKQNVDAMIENIVEPFSQAIIKPNTLDSVTGREAFLRQQSITAKRQAARDALNFIAARRAPGTRMSTFLTPMRDASGLDPSYISDNPSYEEVMNAMITERFRSGKYQVGLVDEPENVARELVTLQALQVMQLNDQLDLMDRFAILIASEVGNEISKHQVSDTSPVNPVGP